MTRAISDRRPAHRHGPGGRQRHAHASAHRAHAQAADRGVRQAAARQRARPPGCGRRRDRRRQRPLSRRPDRAPSRRPARAAHRHLRRARRLLDTGGGVVKALPQPRHGAVLSSQLRHHLDRRREIQPGAPRRSFDPARMDALLLLAATSSSVGYAGRGDFAMAPDGRLRRRTEREVAPFVYAGVAILSPALFAGAPAGRSRSTSCSIAPSKPAGSTACGSKACGCMSAPPRRSPLRNARSSPAQRDGLSAVRNQPESLVRSMHVGPSSNIAGRNIKTVG